uniref:Protein sleepless n=1 Tax=Steinernema glaseri TaxID=37863 RepID=A0A1I8AUN8_9BILA
MITCRPIALRIEPSAADARNSASQLVTLVPFLSCLPKRLAFRETVCASKLRPMATVAVDVARATALVLVLLPIATALNCFICGDNDLDEFGECSSQFQYDCGSYARRFDASERIYCRTTRNKSANNTYTIMKECISETDHYKTFPRKSYPLDEECDLIDVNGYEVAYCLCRHNDLCNEKSIADQFIAFEELHPELFSEAPTDRSLPSEQATSTFPSAAFPSEVDLRRQPSNVQVPKSGDGVSDIDISAPHIFVQPTDHDSRNHKKVHSSSTLMETEDLGPQIQGLRCLQCGQANVADSADCSQQIVVDCQRQLGETDGGRSFCFSRLTSLAPNQNAVEKMCVSEHTLMRELNVPEVSDGCGFSDSNKVRYCICSGEECNKDSVAQQMLALGSGKRPLSKPILSSSAVPSVPEKPKGISCQVCSEGNMVDPNDCRRSVVTDCGPQAVCLTRQTQLSNGAYSLEKRCISRSEYAENFPDEKGEMNVGCGSAFDGFVNYCMCDSDLCNAGSLVEQAQVLGARKTFTPMTTSPRPVAPSTARNTPPAPSTNSFSHEVPPLIITHPSNGFRDSSSPAPVSNTKSVKDRQERWKEFGNGVPTSLAFATALLLPLVLRFL